MGLFGRSLLTIYQERPVKETVTQTRQRTSFVHILCVCVVIYSIRVCIDSNIYAHMYDGGMSCWSEATSLKVQIFNMAHVYYMYIYIIEWNMLIRCISCNFYNMYILPNIHINIICAIHFAHHLHIFF